MRHWGIGAIEALGPLGFGLGLGLDTALPPLTLGATERVGRACGRGG